MRRSILLPAWAASALAVGAALAASAVMAQTAPVVTAPAPDSAAVVKPAAPVAKASAPLPWNKPKTTPAGSDAAAAPATAAPAATATAAASKTGAAATAAVKVDPTKPPAKAAAGEVMSGPMAATHAFFGANTYAAPAPSKTAVRAGCTRLAHSAIDVGKENPIKFSREGIDNQIAVLSKTKGWKATAKSDEKIICTEYVNLGLFGQEYTCRVETTVCPK